jgi:hypothetical protein
MKCRIECRQFLGKAQLWLANCPYQQAAGFNRQFDRHTHGESRGMRDCCGNADRQAISPALHLQRGSTSHSRRLYQHVYTFYDAFLLVAIRQSEAIPYLCNPVGPPPDADPSTICGHEFPSYAY